MKNKILYLFLLFTLCFSFIESVFAENLEFTVSASIDGEKNTIVKGGNAVINVNVNSDLRIDSCRFAVSSDNGVQFVSAKKSDGSALDVGTDGKIDVVNSSNDGDSSTDMTLLQLNYKVNNDGKVIIKTLDCTAYDDNKTGSHSDVVVELKTIEPTVDTTLSKLSVVGGVLSPNFSSDKKNYSIKLSGTQFSLDFTASNSDFQDDIVVTDGKGKTLDYKNITFTNFNNQGYMPVNITVNKRTVYSLLAVYEESKLNNSLKSLKVDGKSINIENGKYDYTVKIGNSVNIVKIEASLVDSDNFKFTDEFGGLMMVKTSGSITDYPIIIEPSKSSVGGKGVTYTIKLIKEGNASSGGNSSSGNNNQNVNKNPATGSISIFVMMIVLICSLIGSISIYQKNLSNKN